MPDVGLSTPPCSICGGKGTVVYEMAPSGQRARLTEDTYIEDMGGSGTRACACVRDLPATPGKSSWWESETIYSEVVDVPIGSEAVEIQAVCEVPRDNKGYRKLRTAENAFYPPLIDLVTDRDKLMLHSDTARELAAALIAAADACDKANELAVATMPDDEESAFEEAF